MSDNRRRVVAVGEIIWDLLPQGKQFGGAPANFICHAKSLRADAHLISRVGTDDLGREALEWFSGRGFDTTTLQRDEKYPTGTATVSLAKDGQATFTITTNVAWDYLEVSAAARSVVANADAICFGTLLQRSSKSQSSLQTLLKEAKPDALRVLDINLRAPYCSAHVIEASLQRANVLKLNDQELPFLSDLLGLAGDTREQLAELHKRLNLRALIFTRGAQGSTLLAKGEWSDHPGVPIKVCDTVGAGDAFTASVVMGLLRNDPLDQINQTANEIAAYVCTQPGATPLLDVALIHSIVS